MITDYKITEIFCATDSSCVSSTTNLRLFRGIVLRTLINSHCSNLIPNWRNYHTTTNYTNYW